MDRTLEALEEFRALIAGFPVEKTWLLGTQALREAGNSAAFVHEVKARTGFDLEIISGELEAYLSYTGAVMGLKDPGLARPFVLDIGAGSTELFYEEDAEAPSDDDPHGALHSDLHSALNNAPNSVTHGIYGALKGGSAPVGSLRLLENPVPAKEIQAMLNTYWGERGSVGDSMNNRSLVAVGGTATTLGAIHLRMKEYDPEVLLGLRISRSQVQDVIDLLESLSSAERLALPGMLPGREDVMPWGLRILLEAMAYCGRDEVIICDRDLLYGVMYTRNQI